MRRTEQGNSWKQSLKTRNLIHFLNNHLTLIATMWNQLSSAHTTGNKECTVQRHIGQYVIASTAAAISLLVNEADR